jgi:hypothetical protein
MNSRQLLIAVSVAGGIALLAAGVAGGFLLAGHGDVAIKTTSNIGDTGSRVPPAVATPTTSPADVAESPEPAPQVPAPTPRAPVAPSCPTGGVTFAITSGELVQQTGADGSVRYIALVGGIARNTSDATITLASSPGAWGLDAGGSYTIPLSGYWTFGSPNALAPGNAVGWTAESSVSYDADTANSVVRWITNNAGHMVVQWTAGVPSSCSSSVPLVDAR